MKSAILVLMLCAALVAAAPEADNELDRWFNGFYGPNVFFGPHSQLGGHGNEHHHSGHGHHRHRQYVNLEACECDEVIGETTTAGTTTEAYTPTVAGATTTVARDTTTTPTTPGDWYGWTSGTTTLASRKRSINLDDLLAEDNERHVLDFQENTLHQRGGQFLNDDEKESSESSSDETNDEKPHRHQFIPDPVPFVAPAEYVPNSQDEFVHYRRQPGFRDPFTGDCICSRETEATPTIAAATTTVATTTASTTTADPSG